jgi:hypothetical protein
MKAGRRRAKQLAAARGRPVWGLHAASCITRTFLVVWLSGTPANPADLTSRRGAGHQWPTLDRRVALVTSRCPCNGLWTERRRSAVTNRLVDRERRVTNATDLFFSYSTKVVELQYIIDRLCGLVVRVPGCWTRGPCFWFPALPYFLRSSASGTGSTLPREDKWNERKSIGSGLENWD